MADQSPTILIKRCSTCGLEKPATLAHFHPNKGGKYGLRGQCRECRNDRVLVLIRQPHQVERRRSQQSAYVASGRNAERCKRWRGANLDKELASRRKWMAKNAEKVRSTDLARREANREAYRAKQRRADAKVKSNPDLTLRKRMRDRLRCFLKGQKSGTKTEFLLGYSRQELKRHIERQFTSGMTWEKLLAGEIHIDHIIPVAEFAGAKIGTPEFRACWGLTNLRPMWAEQNRQKQAKVLSLL